MKLFFIIPTALLLNGCAAIKEASKSVAVSIDWAGIWEAVSVTFF